jgi:hypothetical protein
MCSATNTRLPFAVIALADRTVERSPRVTICRPVVAARRGTAAARPPAMQTISIDALSTVTGGNSAAAGWADIRTAAQPHCPNTVAANPRAPSTRAQAQRIGNACIAEMGAFKANMGGRSRIQAGIDAAFPR